MKLPALARLPILIAFVLVTACSSGQTPGWTFATTGASVPTETATAGLHATPRATTPTSPPATAPPTATSTDDGIPDPPPEGALGYADFAEQGEMGSYCYDGGCADVAVFPPPAEELPSVQTQGQTLIFSVDKGAFDQWTVDYGPDGGPPTLLTSGGDHVDPDMAAQSPGPQLDFVEFDSPAVGDWVVTVAVYFVGGGSASYAWHVIVE